MNIVRMDHDNAIFPYIKIGDYVIMPSQDEIANIMDEIMGLSPDRPIRVTLNPAFVTVEDFEEDPDVLEVRRMEQE